MKKILFFLRHYNDTDHVVPVIYKLLESTDIKATVIVTSTPELLSDYRLQFLQARYNLSIRWICDYLTTPRRMLHRIMQWSYNRTKYNPARLTLRAWERYIAPIQPLGLQEAIHLLDLEIESVDQAVLAFDWRNSEIQLNPIRPLISAAKSRNLPIVALPHGDSAYFNRMFYQRYINYDFWDRFHNDAFDHIVVPNEITAGRYRPYMAPEQIHVFGSPRYNREWLDILEPLVPTYKNSRADDRRRVILFLRNPIFPVFWNELGRTLSLITQFEEIYLVVKHHTRQSTLSIKKFLGSNNEPWRHRDNIEFVYDDVHSSALLKWGDLVLDLGTSVVSEAVMHKTPVLALEYVHANVSTLAHFMPSTALRCRDDLYDALVELIEDSELPNYLYEDERHAYIREIIETPSHQVLDRFTEFFHSLLVQGN